jgi:hypothetical protein
MKPNFVEWMSKRSVFQNLAMPVYLLTPASKLSAYVD